MDRRSELRMEMCVFLPSGDHPTEIDYEHFGSESEPYTYEESDTRRKETNTCE